MANTISGCTNYLRKSDEEHYGTDGPAASQSYVDDHFPQNFRKFYKILQKNISKKRST